MSYDPDEFSDKKEEVADLDRLLTRLQDCDLSEWDQDFVDNMVKRLSKFFDRIHVTPLQWEQLERMRRQHGIKEEGRS